MPPAPAVFHIVVRLPIVSCVVFLVVMAVPPLFVVFTLTLSVIGIIVMTMVVGCKVFMQASKWVTTL